MLCHCAPSFNDYTIARLYRGTKLLHIVKFWYFYINLTVVVENGGDGVDLLLT